MATTNVPSLTFTPTGVQLPAEGAILNGVLADMNTCFGGNMSLSLSSPQGQLAQSFTAIIGEKNDEVLELVNLVDPDTSSGRYQDAIGRIYFMTRIAASGTLVTATCVGLVGTLIPAGSIAYDPTTGYRYASLNDTTIPSSGSIDVQFQCLTPGPIGCPIGALSKIYKAVTGWDTVFNATAGVPGNNAESRADFEYRRRASVAANSVNSIQAVRAAVLAVTNVLDAYVDDNSTSSTVNKGSTNYPVLPYSIYVCVAGGAAADVAKAIWSKKSLGCQYNGSTTYTYTDTSGGVTPYPTYLIKWVTPTNLPIYYKVQIVNSATLPSNISDLIKTAIYNAFYGIDGGQRARIGATLYAGRYYTGIAQADPNIEILSVTLGTSASPTTTSVAVGIDQLPTLDTANIQVVLV